MPKLITLGNHPAVRLLNLVIIVKTFESHTEINSRPYRMCRSHLASRITGADGRHKKGWNACGSFYRSLCRISGRSSEYR